MAGTEKVTEKDPLILDTYLLDRRVLGNQSYCSHRQVLDQWVSIHPRFCKDYCGRKRPPYLSAHPVIVKNTIKEVLFMKVHQVIMVICPSFMTNLQDNFRYIMTPTNFLMISIIHDKMTVILFFLPEIVLVFNFSNLSMNTLGM